MLASIPTFIAAAFASLWQFLCRLLSFPFAVLYEWRVRRFEKRGVAARRRELLSAVPHGGAVLEVGAGAGATLAAGAYAAAPGRFSKVVCSEPDPGMRARLARLAKRTEAEGSGADIEVADAALPRLPYPDNSFHAVVAFMVLSHVGDRARALEEICRVLKPGGKLLLMDHAAHDVVMDESEYWFLEWFRFVHVRGGRRKARIQVLLADIEKEKRLQPDFVSTMETHGFFKEICYGSYSKTS